MESNPLIANIKNSILLLNERLKNPYKLNEFLNEKNPSDLMFKDCCFISKKGIILPFSYDVRRVLDTKSNYINNI